MDNKTLELYCAIAPVSRGRLYIYIYIPLFGYNLFPVTVDGDKIVTRDRPTKVSNKSVLQESLLKVYKSVS